MLAPHPDDAALSVGGLMLRLRDRVVLLTIFGRSNYTSRGFRPDWREVSAIRKAEDAAFAARVGATLQYVDLPEAALRIGPSIRQVFARAGARVRGCPGLEGTLDDAVRVIGPQAVLAPAALGGHVDHILVRRVAARVARRRDVPIAYYEDLPYAAAIGARTLQDAIRSFDAALEPIAIDITPQLSEKLRLLRLYKSQLGSSEAGAVRRHGARWGAGAVERLWSRRPWPGVIDGARS